MPPEIPPKSMSAVPNYLRKFVDDSKDLPPGHIFNLYAPMWASDNFNSAHGDVAETKWSIAKDIPSKKAIEARGNFPAKPKRQVRDSGKKETLDRCANNFPPEVKCIQENIIKRQRSLAEIDGALLIPCRLNAPLATGLGNEHPVENGFAFLSPYGLPYIAGSGIKGALRRAAELMALFGEEYATKNYDVQDFCMLDVWWLFGFEGFGASYWACSKRKQKKDEDDASYKEAMKEVDHYIQAMKKQQEKLEAREDFPEFLKKIKLNDEDRSLIASALAEGKKDLIEKISFRGALTFWDAFPACNKMAFEILTPHYSHYYQNGDSPHDSGQPNPNSFLVVPQGSSFNLIVQCDETGLPNKSFDWQKLCKSIIEFASKWQGFGSKTAVGYGAFVCDQELMQKLEADKKEAEKNAAEEARLNSMSEYSRKIEEFNKILNAEIARRPAYVVNESKINAELNGFYAVCESLTIPEEKDAAIEALNKLFNYVKVNDKKRKEVRAEIDKLSKK